MYQELYADPDNIRHLFGVNQTRKSASAGHFLTQPYFFDKQTPCLVKYYDVIGFTSDSLVKLNKNAEKLVRSVILTELKQ
jgi:hypothetical protein